VYAVLVPQVEGRPPDEAEIVQRAQRGDVHAYEELVQRYTQMAFRCAYLVTGSAAEAEDASQDAFVKAYQALPRFRPEGSFRPWLLRIVGNEARNRRRADRRRAALELRLAEGLRRGSGDRSPEAQAEAAEERQAPADGEHAVVAELGLVEAGQQLGGFGGGPQLRLAIITWIERTYHRRRRQDRLGRLTPIEFETLHHADHAA